MTGLLLPCGEYRVRHTESRLLHGRPHAVTTGQQQPSQDILTAHLRPCLTRALVNTNRLGFARVCTHTENTETYVVVSVWFQELRLANLGGKSSLHWMLGVSRCADLLQHRPWPCPPSNLSFTKHLTPLLS